MANYQLEYSQIVRRKLKSLRAYLKAEYGEDVSKTAIKKITDAARGLQKFPNKGVDLSSIFDIDTDYKYFLVSPNYIFYYIEDDTVYIAEMFNEREDFMYQLFGIHSHTSESEDYWGE
ncbi:type II toxin-antitoxin system RelE/ParE family toxin [Pseudobutyrivibrio sp. MD2005]|uniref:type II toxin-antitoxin system RelE/ParE family toxin n=1 Tax=Pseudobutyrivibrio sp. MD2005 TaxID=1410616 RepID=UPI00055D6CFA|nr:type II toxin-antitoxin system RelE/ParE family toxin [Pseudobutyrivibrio sp. MD2005]